MDLGLDSRGMRFAKDVRNQLTSMVGEGGERLERLRRKERDDQKGDLHDQDPAADPEEEELESVAPGAGAGSTLLKTKGSTGDFQSGGEPPNKRMRVQEGGGAGPSGRVRDRDREMYRGFSEKTGSLREALTTGFANKLARRMPHHNGYRTMVEGHSQLVQVHPNCADLAVNDDGLYPDWIIYHELVNTGRPCVRQVCAIEGRWAERLLPRLEQVNVQRLSGGATTALAMAEAERRDKAVKAKAAADKAVGAASTKEAAGAKKDDAAIDAARERYLARKKAGGKK